MASCTPNEAKLSDANTSEPTLAEQVAMEQILDEIKSVVSRVNNFDVMVGARLDILDSSLSEIKTTITAVESTLSAVTNRVTELEKHMEKAEDRISAVETATVPTTPAYPPWRKQQSNYS